MKQANDISKVIDNAFDEMLSVAAHEACREEAERIIIPEKKTDYSSEHKKKMSELFIRYKRREMIKKLAKASKYAACILLAFVTVTAVTVFSVDAWRTRVLNYIYDPSAPGTEFHFDDKGGKYFSEDGLVLNYVPRGFHLENDFSDNKTICLKFSNDDNDYFLVETYGTTNNIGMDTENSEIKAITVNGNDALLIINEKGYNIFWHDKKTAYSVFGNFSQNEIIKIVENIEYK